MCARKFKLTPEEAEIVRKGREAFERSRNAPMASEALQKKMQDQVGLAPTPERPRRSKKGRKA